MKGLIFTYLMTYGGAAVALVNPFVGLLIYICFAIIKPEAMWFWSVPIGNYSRIVAIALLIGWVVQGLGNWSFGRARLTVVSLVGFMLWATFGAFMAPHRGAAWAFIEMLAKIVLPFLVGITTIDSVQKLKQLAWVIVLSQGYLAYELNMSYYSGNNRAALEGFGDMDNNCVAISMVSCVALAFFLGLHSPSWIGKGLALLSSLLMTHVVMFSFSRGGMLALVITAGVAYWFVPKKPAHLLVFACAILLAWRLAGHEVTERFLTIFASAEERDTSAQSRLDLWRACLDTMSQHPVFGVGPNHWGFVVDKYGYKQGKLAHTLWLQTGAELGIPGLGLLLLFYGSVVFRLGRIIKTKSQVADPWFRDAGRMVVAGLIGFAIAAQFVSLYGLEVPYYIALIGAGVLKLSSTAAEPAQQPALVRPADGPWLQVRPAHLENIG
jgi:probable O-glycosylation ligase (exosortase A-associated)